MTEEEIIQQYMERFEKRLAELREIQEREVWRPWPDRTENIGPDGHFYFSGAFKEMTKPSE